MRCRRNRRRWSPLAANPGGRTRARRAPARRSSGRSSRPAPCRPSRGGCALPPRQELERACAASGFSSVGERRIGIAQAVEDGVAFPVAGVRHVVGVGENLGVGLAQHLGDLGLASRRRTCLPRLPSRHRARRQSRRPRRSSRAAASRPSPRCAARRARCRSRARPRTSGRGAGRCRRASSRSAARASARRSSSGQSRRRDGRRCRPGRCG